MVAELKPVAAACLPLLMEPDMPKRMSAKGQNGWLRAGEEFVRQPLHDGHGALIQHVLVRYFVHRVQRQVIALEVGYSERQLSAWLSGRNCETYADPVRKALADLGIELWRGQRERSGRAEEVIAAQCSLLNDAARLLATDVRPEAARVRTLARLLTAGREPLG